MRRFCFEHVNSTRIDIYWGSRRAESRDRLVADSAPLFTISEMLEKIYSNLLVKARLRRAKYSVVAVCLIVIEAMHLPSMAAQEPKVAGHTGELSVERFVDERSNKIFARVTKNGIGVIAPFRLPQDFAQSKDLDSFLMTRSEGGTSMRLRICFCDERVNHDVLLNMYKHDQPMFEGYKTRTIGEVGEPIATVVLEKMDRESPVRPRLVFRCYVSEHGLNQCIGKVRLTDSATVDYRLLLSSFQKSELDRATNLLEKTIEQLTGSKPWYEWEHLELQSTKDKILSVIGPYGSYVVPKKSVAITGRSHPEFMFSESSEHYTLSFTLEFDSYSHYRQEQHLRNKRRVSGRYASIPAFRAFNKELGKSTGHYFYKAEVDHVNGQSEVIFRCGHRKLDQPCLGATPIHNEAIARFQFTGDYELALKEMFDLVASIRR